ncbi:PVC-type heme-binding CxxCH protein [Rosistilla oblonga]|uniref:Cytochrome c n=1 Tax=Rosistilla oblonga TaxID=2527990 RepID=A0A518J180_9BACT|nr:PVC-type heme-binding CxxCH protein [Rosistilla oblonga]QDV59087.1 Cytochrome c [Rosistilla oblonga]
MNQRSTAWIVTCALLFLASSLLAQDATDQPQRPALEYQRWSGAINVPDPVAISVDDQGRVFVTQTRRRKSQDLDIRANRDWIPDDVGFKSVEDKRQFYHSKLAIGGDDKQQSKHVGDLNKDGHHDWRDLTVISERIFRLVDSDRDGTADEITTFAEGFNTEVTGIAAGVMALDGDVWATIAPDVWKLKDADGDGVADSREIMATGFGLHIAYAGHDMHGLTLGPDGKVYWSIGDKGINVTTKEGLNIAYPNEGGVMRCNPDGSDFEVFAHGLRNVQEFAFDQYGNIFGIDNDADQPGERERFIAIVDGMDAGWRCHYQYRGSDYNPWTDEQLWQIAQDQHPAYIIPPISHYIDGPAGFKFNPGTAFSPAYYNYFFATNAPRGHQYAFRVESDGDSFRMVDAHEIGSGNAIVGLAFGPDGALYGADWDGGYPLDEKGSVIRIDVPGADLAVRGEVQKLLAEGFDEREVDELVALLSHADMRVRMGAQFALVEKKQAERLQSHLSSQSVEQLAKLHCVWGLGQLGRSGDKTVIPALVDAFSDPDAAVRAQAAKTIGEIRQANEIAGTVSGLIDLLDDADLHVRVNAGLAIARQPDPVAVEPLLKQSGLLNTDQHYLRHSLVSALAASASDSQLAAQADNQSEMTRLVCVLALRRQGSPMVSEFLADPSAWVSAAAARAIHDDLSIPNALPNLAAALENSANYGEPFVRRAINANFRLGTAAAASRLLDYASNKEHPVELRVDACNALSQWLAPPVLDRVEGIRRDLPVDSRTFDRDQAATVLGQLAATGEPNVVVAAVRAARMMKVVIAPAALIGLLENERALTELRIQALSSIVQMDHESAKVLLVASADSSDTALSIYAIETLADRYPSDALTILERKLQQTDVIAVKQACIAGLGKIANRDADAILQRLASQLLDESLPSELSLDVYQAVQSRAEDAAPMRSIQESLSRQQTERAAALKLGDTADQIKFAFSGQGGDAERGKQIFQTNLRAQCSRCHRIGKRGSNIGPELTKIGKQRDLNHLLRAVVAPSADIEPKYFTQVVLLLSGQAVKGSIKSENDDETIVIDSSGKEIKISSDEIEEIIDQKVSLMPDMTEALSPQEVRDLVAFLNSLK